ncbi:MAG TPA: DUF5060 domain-containing protein, partial [Planctomycetota bacterium]|nr:DUF5060 domain-containing protein [Planctomycetota bacterium]
MRFLIVAALCAAPAAAQTAGGSISGELRKWHRVTITFDGPSTSESAGTNPFRDYRLDVTFTKGTRSFRVPGFYAADGNAAETSAASGNKWRVHFTPDEEGTWTYSASFRTGTDVAIQASATAGTATSFNGASGSFTVGATNKTGRDHRGKGRLRYVGKHHLQFAQTGEWFIKGGADSPENFLAYFEFDGTPTTKHRYDPHAGDWRTGDPTWKGGKGKNIIGALNYLSGKGMNSVYFLTMNVNGDGKDVWPWTSDAERYRFDVSKLDQWEIVLSHMDKLGIQLHVVTQETENDQLLDGGALGTQRKLYYRELVARFAHHLGIVWNIGEENTNTDAQRKEFASHIRGLDPYDHPIVIHTYPGQYDAVYTPLLGHAAYEGPSLQMGSRSATHAETVKWVRNSAANGRRWFVCLDEIGGANEGVLPDANDFWHDSVRTQALWGNLMGGGAGCEWYFGYSYPHSDLTCEDWRSRDHMWDLTRIAMDFFRQHLPFQDMTPNDGLVSTGWCLNKGGEVYAVYLPSGGTASLSVGTGTYSVQWYDPRNGGALMNGSVTSITGSGSKSLGSPPNNSTKDWAVLVKLTSGTGGGGGGTTPAVTSLTLVNADSDLDIGPLTNGQTLNLATLPTRNLNVRADVSGTVGSVRFGYDGNASYSTESAAPYALAGDSSGNYNAWTPSTGSHTLTATPYTLSAAGGTAGTALTVAFSVVDDASNTPPSVSITSPANNATFAAGSTITIQANASDPDGTVSFVDFYRGTTLIAMDTASPWSATWTNVPAGTYVLTAKATDNDAATATSGGVTITVTSTGGQAVSSLTLINADTDQPIAGFDPIANGATLNLDTLPTRNLNIRANTTPSIVGSVRFGYDGNANVRTENAAPYALAGDSSGNYYAWTPTAGSHSVTATPYTGSNASGTAGTAKTITFTATSSAALTAVGASAPSDPGATGPEIGAGPEPVATSDDGGGSGRSDCGALGLELFLGLGLAAAIRSRRMLRKGAVTLAFLGLGLSAQAQVYQESGGIVVVEVESHPTAGAWVKETSIAGFTGTAYYRWNGANSFGTGGNGTLTYRINITNAGEYQLRLRNYHNHPTDNTLENDCFTKMDGGSWIKTYSSSGNANKWNWATTHEPTSGTHLTPKYTLTAGEHTFYISGRSANFRIDRFHLHLPNVTGAT